MNILIIGFGKLGSSLYVALSRSHQVRVAGNKPWQEEWLPYIVKTAYNENLTSGQAAAAEVVILAVPDDQIAGVAARLARIPLKGKIVVHTSGARNSTVLDCCKLRGATTASVHPMQTFPARFQPPRIWQGILCSYEGSPEGYSRISSCFAELGVRMISLTADQKLAVHLAATICSNFAVALLALAEEIVAISGIEDVGARELLLPLFKQVARNYESSDVHEILSGPVQRGDLETIRKHIHFLDSNSPGHSDLYRELCRLLLENDRFNIHNRAVLKKGLSQ